MEPEKRNWEAYAAHAWPVLTQCAAERSVITYGELGALIELHHRPIRYVLSVIQDYCKDAKLPPLTILVINQDTRLPGVGFIAVDADHLESGMEEVYRFDWRYVANPFDYALEGWSEEALAQRVVEEPRDAESVYSLVRDRGIVQSIFRRALLATYKGECAFCGLSLPQALDGAHIIRWAEASEAQRLDVRNGLLLCAVHHRLFDAGVVVVGQEGTIRFTGSPTQLASGIDEAMTSALDGHRVRIPAREDHKPSLDALMWRETAARQAASIRTP